MKRGTPMKRTGWRRASTTAPTTPRAEPTRAKRVADRALRALKNAPACDPAKAAKKQLAAQERRPAAAVQSPACSPITSTASRPRPKTKAQRNKQLRQMARDKPCLLLVPGHCTHDRSTVVCCHSNLSAHGKAGARKADDHYSAWGCSACHRWLDQGTAPRAQKTSVFMAAHLRQVQEWRAIAFDPRSAPRDKAAALWALERLNALPNLRPALDSCARHATSSGVNL